MACCVCRAVCGVRRVVTEPGGGACAGRIAAWAALALGGGGCALPRVRCGAPARSSKLVERVPFQRVAVLPVGALLALRVGALMSWARRRDVASALGPSAGSPSWPRAAEPLWLQSLGKAYACMCVHARARTCMRVHARARVPSVACVRECVHRCMRAWVHACARVRVCMRMTLIGVTFGESFGKRLSNISSPTPPRSVGHTTCHRVVDSICPSQFKVKTTAPKSYVVRPCSGTLRPGDTQEPCGISVAFSVPRGCTIIVVSRHLSIWGLKELFLALSLDSLG